MRRKIPEHHTMNSLASSKPGTPKVSGTTSPQDFAKKCGFYIRAFWIFPY